MGGGGAGTAKVCRKFTTDNITGTYRGGGEGEGGAFSNIGKLLNKKTLPKGPHKFAQTDTEF